jgi:tetratricopeptide (TPR) repeat protein
MHTARSFLRPALVVALVMPLVSCGFFDQLSAMRTFKDANTLYQRGDYEGAIEEYGRVIDVVEADPASELSQVMTVAYFYLANSYDSLYTPAFRGQPENDGLLDQAIEYYKLAADRIPDPEFQTLSMQYLVAAYGPDKLNDPTNRAVLLQEMVQLDPANPDNYLALAQLFAEAGLFEEAEAIFLDVREMQPGDPTIHLQLAEFYNHHGDFEKTIEALRERARIEPDNPEAHYTISVYFWNKAFRDFRITQEQKAEYIFAGIEATDLAIELNDRYVDALVYKNILLRMQANMSNDVDEQDALIAEADELRDRAVQIQDEARGEATAAAAAAAEGDGGQ